VENLKQFAAPHVAECSKPGWLLLCLTY